MYSKKTNFKLCYMVFVSILVFFLATDVFAQPVAINTTGNDADPGSILDVSANDKGVLLPRLTTVQKDDISTPAEGLLIYNISTKCFEYWNGNDWQNMGNCATGTPVAPLTNTNKGGVAVNENGTPPHGSAALDVKANDKGVLFPRMTTAQRDNMPEKSQGLIIYNTDLKIFEFWESNNWHPL